MKCELEFPPRDKRIYILCNYNNDLFLATKGQLIHYDNCNYMPSYIQKDFRGDDLCLYKYEDKTFKLYKSLSLDAGQITKLKNNNLIIYSSNELRLYKLI